MNWERPKFTTTSAAYHITCGRWTICKALVRGEWVYTLIDGKERVITGTLEACKAEAESRGREAA